MRDEGCCQICKSVKPCVREKGSLAYLCEICGGVDIKCSGCMYLENGFCELHEWVPWEPGHNDILRKAIKAAAMNP